jgi:RimJ/RimL family protein N-acetyltransferase
MNISTDRLLLRRFRRDDAVAFAAYRSDPDVARYQSWSAPFPVDDATALLEDLATRDPQSPGWFQYAIELRSETTLIGDVGVNLHENLMQADLGFTIAPAYQHRGYASEAVRSVLDRLFVEQALHRVSADCDARNDASARLLDRLGFRREGHRVANTWLKGEWTDDLLFGLLRHDWHAGPAGGQR